jgi:NADH dehydrogenase
LEGASPALTNPHVVIVGGGFGGLSAARALGEQPVRVTVVDRQNHHLFQPLLYQVATAALSPGDIASPIRSVLSRYANIRVWLGEAKAVDVVSRRLVLADGELSYDYLILAAGACHAYFGHDDWEDAAPGLKSLEDALEMRRRILLAFERAERTEDEAARQALLTFVVVGGGPTGVELAGAIREIARHTLARDFRSIDATRARVVLVEAGPRILPVFSEKLSQAAQRSLERLGVEVKVGTQVTGVTREAVHLGRDVLPARTTLWAAGVAASPLARSLGVALDRAGRVPVEPDLSLPGHPEVYVIGDLAAAAGPRGFPLPGLAPVAMQEGAAAAQNIELARSGLPTRPFRYSDHGTMATIGRAAAIAQVGRIQLSGLIAWLAWLFIHILYLIGFRNRFAVLGNWTWSYVTWRRGARLMTDVNPRSVVEASLPPATPRGDRTGATP